MEIKPKSGIYIGCLQMVNYMLSQIYPVSSDMNRSEVIPKHLSWILVIIEDAAEGDLR